MRMEHTVLKFKNWSGRQKFLQALLVSYDSYAAPLGSHASGPKLANLLEQKLNKTLDLHQAATGGQPWRWSPNWDRRERRQALFQHQLSHFLAWIRPVNRTDVAAEKANCHNQTHWQYCMECHVMFCQQFWKPQTILHIYNYTHACYRFNLTFVFTYFLS
jgi:hypothetical protein